MRFILLRDDDTNALTPIECLETLYRPFLAHGLPVNLATIPEVRTHARTPEGAREGFLPVKLNPAVETVPLAENRALTTYLRDNPGYHIAQHGCYHDTFEFDQGNRGEIVRRIERGRERLGEAGFSDVETFVAPHDKLSRVAYEEAARRFSIISTGWFEMRRLPKSWWPRFLLKKMRGRRHWRIDGTQLLSHPGCLLSYRRRPETILPAIRHAIGQQRITVLVTHWWEYFREGVPNQPFIRALHETAEFLAADATLRVIRFRDLVKEHALARPAIVQ